LAAQWDVSAEGCFGSVENLAKPPKYHQWPLKWHWITWLTRPTLSERIFDVCSAFLVAGDDELEHFSVEVCNGLADVVPGVSDQKNKNTVKNAASYWRRSSSCPHLHTPCLPQLMPSVCTSMNIALAFSIYPRESWGLCWPTVRPLNEC